jgi:hypothetical protein
LRERAAVLGGKGRPDGKNAAEHSVEVGAPYERTSFDDREPVGGENEGRETKPQLFPASDGSAVQQYALSLVTAEVDLRLEAGPLLLTPQPDPCRPLAEPNRLLLGAGTGGETLAAEV